MKLRLKWVNPNIIPTEVSIYRSDEIVNVSTFTTPLVTLPGTTDTWTDENVARDATYYYYWKVTTTDDVVWSSPYKVLIVPYSGPGSQEIIYGTYDLGYCGLVTWQELFSTTDIALAIGLSTDTLIKDSLLPTWAKFVRNGKFLFIPTTPLANTSFLNLYNLGSVFGVPGPGPWQPGATRIDQLFLIEKGIHKFIIRLPTGADDRNNPTRTVAADANVDIRKYSEAADIMYPLFRVVASSQRLPGLFNATVPSFSNLGCLAQESYSGGALNAMNNAPAGQGVALEKLTSRTTSVSLAWMPILELIPTQTLEVTL